VEHPVGTDPGGHQYRHLPQQPGQPDRVVARVEHDQDRWVTLDPLPGGADPVDNLPDLLRGHLGDIVGRGDPLDVQDVRPGRSACFECGHERVRPARDHLRGTLTPAVDMTERPARRGRRVRPQPVTHINSQDDPALAVTRQREPHNQPAQPVEVHPARVDRVVQRSMTTPVLGGQRQPHQTVHRSISTQLGVGAFLLE